MKFVGGKDEFSILLNEIYDNLKEISEKLNDGVEREEWIVADYEDIPDSLVSKYGLNEFWEWQELLKKYDFKAI